LLFRLFSVCGPRFEQSNAVCRWQTAATSSKTGCNYDLRLWRKCNESRHSDAAKRQPNLGTRTPRSGSRISALGRRKAAVESRHCVGASFLSFAPTISDGQSAIIPLLLLLKSQPLRWVVICFFGRMWASAPTNSKNVIH